MQSKFFPSLNDDSDVPSDKIISKEQKVGNVIKSSWTDPKTNHVYEITEKGAKGPDADYSVEYRAKEIALNRAKQYEEKPTILEESPETQEPEPDTNPIVLETKLRERALREARFEISTLPSRDKLPRFETDDDIPEPEGHFNRRGYNEINRTYTAPSDALMYGIGTAQSRPRPEIANSEVSKSKPEHVYVGPEKSTTIAMKAVFRNMMGTIQKGKNRVEVEVSNKPEIETMISSIVNSGIEKSWTPPDTLVMPTKPDAVAITVGKRALDSIQAFRNVPEVSSLSNSEKDSLILAIGRAMLNLAVSPSTDKQKLFTKITEEEPLVHDTLKKKILSAIDPQVVLKSLGPELTAMAFKQENKLNTNVRPSDPQNAMKKSTPSVLQAPTNSRTEPNSRPMFGANDSGFMERNQMKEIREDLRKDIPQKPPVLEYNFSTNRNKINYWKE